MTQTQLLFVLIAATFAVTAVEADTEKKGTGFGKRVEGKLNVHLVPHTHDDVGWLKTVDQYFYGANNSIQFAGVQYILDTVVKELAENPNRKFIYVEQAFFQRWWREQDDDTKNLVKSLVAKGQLEFINGGWCMHDEAATHYVAMIDQTTLGHRYLLNEFGAIPKIGWQIDPFGHSSTQAALLSARVGFEGLFFARIDYQDYYYRNLNKEFEFIWRPSSSLGVSGQIFTGAFERNGYGPPYGFDWDIFSSDAPIQDDPELEDYNVPTIVDSFVWEMQDQFSSNVGDDIMLTLGSDFQYSDARTWFKNLDKLIDHVNADGRLNIFYSTPSEYVKAKNSYNVSWTVKTDDFFPYSDCPHCMWTGYFTSRPALKRYVRINSGYLNAARQIETLGAGDGSATHRLDEALGVAQHHDAVSGTSKQHVAYDYARRLSEGYHVASEAVNTLFSSFTNKTGKVPTFTQCTLFNESICEVTQTNNAFAVFVYNPLGRARDELVRIPVTLSSYVVYDSSANVVASQTLPSFQPFPKNKPSPYSLYFRVTTPAIGFNTYFVQPSSVTQPAVRKVDNDAPVIIENAVVQVQFNNGRLSSITNKKTGTTTTATQDFLWYASFVGRDQNSGAYIFRPNSTDAYPVSGTPTVQQVVGNIVSEIRVTLGDWLAQTIRITGDEPQVEFEYHVGSIPFEDGVGKELITRYTTDLKTDSLFWTDSNGREFQQRKRNYRPTWPLTVFEPVAGNYYPINAAAYIKDSTRFFSILNDRSQGGGSIQDGQFEVMIHRRVLHDDARGVDEPLNETDGITPYPDPKRVGTGLHITGSHYIFLEDPTGSPFSSVRSLQSRLFSPVVLAFSPTATGLNVVKDWIVDHFVSASVVATDLPVNIELLTLQAVTNNTHLLRLSHQFGVDEDPVLSKPVTIDLTTLFIPDFPIFNLKEVSLTANQPVTELTQLNWNTEGSDQSDVNLGSYKIIPFDGSTVTINPMDIRTFTFTISP